MVGWFCVKARPIWLGDVTHGDLFGRRLMASGRELPIHTPTECGRATLPSVGRRYIFSPVGLPTYVRERKCRHATLPHRRVVHAFTALWRVLYYVGVRT